MSARRRRSNEEVNPGPLHESAHRARENSSSLPGFPPVARAERFAPPVPVWKDKLRESLICSGRVVEKLETRGASSLQCAVRACSHLVLPGARMCRPDQPQRIRTVSSGSAPPRAAAGPPDTAAVRKMKPAANRPSFENYSIPPKKRLKPLLPAPSNYPRATCARFRAPSILRSRSTMRETTDLNLANAFRRHFPAIIISRTLSRDIFERSLSRERSPETFPGDHYLADARKRDFRPVFTGRLPG